MSRRMKRHTAYGIAALVWIGVLVFFSAQTAAESGAVSGAVVNGLLSWLLDRGVPFGILDHLTRKTAHALAFAAEGALCYLCVSCVHTRMKALAISEAACAVIAVCNELQQLLSSGRSCEVRDMCIDSAGALAGMLAVLILTTLTKRHKGSTGE